MWVEDRTKKTLPARLYESTADHRSPWPVILTYRYLCIVQIMVGLASRSRGLGSARARNDNVILTLAGVATRQHATLPVTRSPHRPILKPSPVQYSGPEDIHPVVWCCRSNPVHYCVSTWSILPVSAALVYHIVHITSEIPNYCSESNTTCTG
jgi:hypothetical protein